ncbi:MAG: beta-aspartyl-peptidase [Acidobacteria bacterium]|nr:beta-aspartyl-peptidase [Acidobacteriota bacterium]
MAESPAMFSLLRNARVWAPEALGVCDLAVVNGRIAALAPALDSFPSWCNAIETDLEGRTVIPALIDGHVHITGGGGEAGPGSRIPPLSAETFRAAGIGTVVGLLGTDDTTRTTGDLVAWTRELGAQDVSAYCLTGGYHVPLTTLTGSVRGDMAWIDVVIGVGELAISDHRSSRPSNEELVRIAADAHVGGLMSGKAGILHLHIGDGPAGLDPIRKALASSDLPAAVFHPTHVNRRKALFEEALDLARQGSPVDVTAFPVAADEDGWAAPDALIRYLESDAPDDLITMTSDGGGCLPAFDTDGQVTSYEVAAPRALADAFRAAVVAGVPIETALPCLTTNPARVFGLVGKGALERGKAADLVVLDDLLMPQRVMLGGTWYGPDGTASPRMRSNDD